MFVFRSSPIDVCGWKASKDPHLHTCCRHLTSNHRGQRESRGGRNFLNFFVNEEKAKKIFNVCRYRCCLMYTKHCMWVLMKFFESGKSAFPSAKILFIFIRLPSYVKKFPRNQRSEEEFAHDFRKAGEGETVAGTGAGVVVRSDRYIHIIIIWI